jgi:hypothetical protein
MIDDKNVRIQVYSEYDGHSIQVLNADGDKVLHASRWNHEDYGRGVGGQANFVGLLEWLGYTVYHEELY